MKNVIFLLAGLLNIIPLFSQNVTHLTKINNAQSFKQEKELGAVAPNNPWVIGSGSQIGYMFGGAKGFADDILVSASILYDYKPFKKSDLHLPVMGNISPLITSIVMGQTDDQVALSIRDLISSNRGISVGIYPWYPIENKESYGLTLFAGGALKINSAVDTISNITTYLNQGRFHLGVEARIGPRMTFSINPYITIFDGEAYNQIFGEKLDVLKGVELSVILPIGNGIGFMLENTITQGRKPILRTGIILTKSLINKDSDEEE